MANPYFHLIGVAWRYAWNERKKFVGVYALFSFCSLGLAVNPLLFGWFVDVLQRDGARILSSAWIYAGCYLGLHLFLSAINGPTRIIERGLAFNISQNFLDDLFHKLLHLPMNWHQDNHSGAVINRLRKGYSSLKSFLQNGFYYFYTFSQFFISLGGMIYFSPVAGTVALLLGCLTIWVILKFDKPFIKTLQDVNEKEHLVSASLSDSLVNIFTVITLRLEKQMKIDLLNKFRAMWPSFRRNIVINEWKWFTANGLIWLIYVIMLMGYVYRHYVPGETFFLGGLVALLGFVNQFTSAFTRIAQVYTDIVGLSTDVKSVDPIEQAYKEKHGDDVHGSLPVQWQQIQIEKLSYFYGPSKQSADDMQADNDILPGAVSIAEVKHGISDIRLVLKRGERVALIGESGSGKSTLLALLRELYSPLPGVEITVDGEAGYAWQSISEQVTLFPQEPEIFENTILHNITLGLPFTEEQVMEACDIVCFTEVLLQLPNGLQSKIQEKGVNLSVGQKQRLALARGVLASRSSSIILLDEPTSSIDVQTAMQIYKRLFESFSDKTIICSVHNLHLLSLFDYTYVLRRGQVVEEGTTEALNAGDYVRLTNIAITS